MINEDLSEGQAVHKIPVINTVDDEDIYERFHYTSVSIYSNYSEKFHPNKNGCDCPAGGCRPGSCKCIDGSTIKLYKHRIDVTGGFPDFYQNILYECNAKTCKGCRGKCSQRLTPETFNLKVEVFKTLAAGFAVRSCQFIETGTFIGEFVGERNRISEQELRPPDYAYKLATETKERNNYVDPYIHGNITRFFNHSCFENLHPFQFYSIHREKSRPSLGFFAYRDIMPGAEMTIDYGHEWWARQIAAAYRKDKSEYYCHCDSYYCMYPAPDKPQLSLDDAAKEVERQLKEDRQKLKAWKAAQAITESELEN